MSGLENNWSDWGPVPEFYPNGNPGAKYGAPDAQYPEFTPQASRLVQHLPDADNGNLSQNAIVYDQPGYSIDPNSPDVQVAGERIHIITTTGKEYMLDGKRLFDKEASEKAGYSVAVYFGDDEIIPTITTGRSWRIDRDEFIDPIAKVERSAGEPQIYDKKSGLLGKAGADPFAKFDNALYDIEERHTQQMAAKEGRLGRRIMKHLSKASNAVKAGAESAKKFFIETDPMIYKKKAMATAAAALALTLVVAPEIDKRQSQTVRGANLVAQTDPISFLARPGRNPTVLATIMLKDIVGNTDATSAQITQYAARISNAAGYPVSKGMDRHIPANTLIPMLTPLPEEAS